MKKEIKKEKPQVLKSTKRAKGAKPNNCANCAGSKFC